MKRAILSIIIIFTFMISAGYKPADSLYEKLYDRLENKEFFRLRDEYSAVKNSLSIWQQLAFSGLINSVFNKPQKSNDDIDELMKLSSAQVPDSVMAKLLEAKFNNYTKLYKYKDAHQTAVELIENYAKYFDENELEELKNDMILYGAVKEVMPQEILKKKTETIQMEQDLAKLYNLNIKLNEVDFKFVFDTGANISVITESNAKKAGLKVIDTEFKVGTATNIKVNSKIAAAENLQIGSLIFKNVLFLVLPDETLEFAGGIYKINGIIGMPVMEASGEFTITKDMELIIPEKTSEMKYRNFALDGNKPVVNGIIGKDTLIFIFDSGANSSTLYNSYYILNKAAIDKNYKRTKIRLGGAGGEMEVDGYKLDEIKLIIGGDGGILKNVSLISQEIKKEKEKYYGNIGRDYMSLFKRVTFNFREMGVEFN